MLIGRDAELGRIQRALALAREGGSDVLVLRGQPGIGKTALLQAAIAHADGMTVLRVRGLEAEAEQPFSGLAVLCRPVVALRDRLPAAQASALASALELEPAAPHARLAIGAALLGLLGLAAEEQPVLVVVDDLQWLDEPSLEALRFAARRLGDGGVAMLLSHRPVAEEPVTGFERLAVGPLDAAGALELLQAGREQPLPEAVARSLAETAAGNPLALREIPALLSRDVLEGRAPIAGPLPPGSTLEKVLARRLDGLPAPTRRALLVAAAAEVRRGDVVLRALAAADLDLTALEPAEEAGVVILHPGEVAFVHPLLRAAAYHAGTTVERRAAHGAVASALTEGDPQRAWQLAAATALPDEAVAAALEQAAQAARARTGFGPAAHAHLRAAELSADPVQRARRLVEAARDLLPAGHPEVGLARLEQAEHVLAIAEGANVTAVAAELHTLRAQLALRTGRTAEARDLLRVQARRLEGEVPVMAALLLLLSSLGAMALRDHVGWLADAEKARELAGGADLLAALAALSAGAAQMTKPDVATGRRLLEEGEARLGGDLAMALALAPEVVALAAHGWLWIEEYERGVDMLDRLVAAGREAASVGALPYPLAARAHGHLFLGRYPQALADAEEAVALADQTGQDPALVVALGMLAAVRAWRGEEEAAVAAAERAIATGERRGVPLPAIYAKFALGLLAAAGEDPEVAIERLEAVRDEALPGNVIWAPSLADAYVRAGRREDALAVVEHYAERTRAPPDRARDARAHARDDRGPRGRGALPRRARAARRRAGAARARAHAARLRRVAAGRGPARGGARPAARGAGRLRADRGAPVRRARPPRAAGRGRDRPAGRDRGDRADPARAARRPARRAGAHEPRGRGGAVREREDDRAPPAQRVPQARRAPPHRARADDGGALASSDRRRGGPGNCGWVAEACLVQFVDLRRPVAWVCDQLPAL